MTLLQGGGVLFVRRAETWLKFYKIMEEVCDECAHD